MATTHSDIVIIGAGCFGLSTALHLKRTNPTLKVTLLDRLPFPALDAASNDTSRIVRADYADPFYATLGKEAIEAWRTDPVFKPFFTETGWIFAEVPEERGGNGFVGKAYKTLKGLGGAVERMEPEEVAKRWKGLSGEMGGWGMYYNAEAGWVDAAGALKAAMFAYLELDGTFIVGEVVSQILAPESEPARILGVRTRDGTSHYASKVIYCTGAWTPSLLPTGLQIHPTGFCVAHWRLTEAEYEIWKTHPVVDLHRHGYFFPPNKDRVMKMGVGMVGYSNLPAGDGDAVTLSLPRTLVDHPGQGIPAISERQIRWILGEAAPGLAEKPFFDTKVCWDGFTGDAQYLIAPHPQLEGCYVAAGGSGHVFKMFPVIGKYVAKMMDNCLDGSVEDRWKWREGTKDAGSCIGGRKLLDLKKELDIGSKL